ncbi:MAG: hypothetical protein ABR562_03185 [Thermoplasmatota archaeon]
MPWPTPAGEAFRHYWLALPLLGLALVAVLVAYVVELVAGRLAMRRSRGLLLATRTAAFAAAFAACVQTIGAGAAWEQQATAFLQANGALRTVAAAVAWLGSFPFVLAALFGLFLWPAARGRWRAAYVALAAGPGLALVVVVLKVVLPRPFLAADPFFAGATAFPDATAALVPAALAIHGALTARLRPGRARWGWRAALALAFAVAPVAAGTARAGDALAGLTLAAAWLAAFQLVVLLLPALLRPDSFLQRALDRMDRSAAAVFARPTPWLLGLICFGVLLRLAGHWLTPAGADAYWALPSA